MAVESVSDDETLLADLVEDFLRQFPHLTVRRHGDTVVAQTNFGNDSRVILAGHLDTVPIVGGNFPPKWLEPGDPLIREDIAATHPDERVLWGRGATDMKSSDAVFLYLAATYGNPQTSSSEGVGESEASHSQTSSSEGAVESEASHSQTPSSEGVGERAARAGGSNQPSSDRPKYDITYVFYDHEEVSADQNGLRKVVESHPDWIQGDFAIIGEPTDCGIEGGCNGTMRFDVVTHGVAAHSARAWMGDNAIHKAAEVLNRLNNYEPRTIEVDGLEYREGLNATLISGGNGTNVIPEECRIHVNYRFAPDKTLAQAKALMMGEKGNDSSADYPELGNGEHVATGGVFEGFGIEMKDESPAARPGLTSPLAADLVRLVKEATGRDPLPKLGWTDVARFAQLGIPAVNLGAGSPLLAHKHDEQLPESDLPKLLDLLESWLS
ncbi:succinyl-diaminopimelate desuccinylase [Bifidobacterium choloepi]|uniref:succinyl-diaminopimelate desuccinylase n=1 Tax=Bifidobacterium choloepi TaxID=2614131 RepID=UPI001E3D1832|nr:succinyl-diaminopimelate desuccinylase [Bifidobacterium choloepi]